MFTYDSFGRRIRVKARAMRRNPNPGDPTPPPPGTPAPTEPPAPGAPAPTPPAPADLGFPADTPWRDMTPEQQSAYWRHQSQGWETRAKSREDYDAIKQERDQLRDATLTDEQRAAQEAIDEARRDGENTGAERYLQSAVRAHFQRLTGLDDEKTTTALQHVQPQSFTDDQGEIDMTALGKFAETFGTSATASGTPADPIAEAARRQHQAGGAGATSSIAEAARQRAEELKAAAGK